MATKPKKPAAKTTAKDDKTKKVFTTPVFRAAFANSLFTASVMEGAPEGTAPKYGVTALWNPKKFTEREKALWSAIRKEMNRQCIAAFGAPAFAPPGEKKIPPNYKKGIRSGAEKPEYEGFDEPGVVFASMTSLQPPGVIDKDSNEISKEEGNTNEVYSGCYCRATVSIYTYDKGGGKGVALGLRNVQKVKNGPRMDNRTAAKDDFDEDIEDEYQDDEDEFNDDGEGDGEFEDE